MKDTTLFLAVLRTASISNYRIERATSGILKKCRDYAYNWLMHSDKAERMILAFAHGRVNIDERRRMIDVAIMRNRHFRPPHQARKGNYCVICGWDEPMAVRQWRDTANRFMECPRCNHLYEFGESLDVSPAGIEFMAVIDS